MRNPKNEVAALVGSGSDSSTLRYAPQIPPLLDWRAQRCTNRSCADAQARSQPSQALYCPDQGAPLANSRLSLHSVKGATFDPASAPFRFADEPFRRRRPRRHPGDPCGFHRRFRRTCRPRRRIPCSPWDCAMRDHLHVSRSQRGPCAQRKGSRRWRKARGEGSGRGAYAHRVEDNLFHRPAAAPLCHMRFPMESRPGVEFGVTWATDSRPSTPKDQSITAARREPEHEQQQRRLGHDRDTASTAFPAIRVRGC